MLKMEKKKSERNIFGFDGSFINFCDKLFDVMALGFLWILCSLPIITIGASSTALYYAMVKCIKKGDGYIAKEFFRSFRMNLISGTILWVLIAAATFAFEYRHFNERNGWKSGVVFYLRICHHFNLYFSSILLYFSGSFQI
mgnify:CR=1 FL=1